MTLLVLSEHFAHNVHSQEHGPVGRNRAQQARHEASVEANEPAVGVELPDGLRHASEGPFLGDHAIRLDCRFDDVERVEPAPKSTPASPPAVKMCVTGSFF